MQKIDVKRERNYGIDLLRVVSMFYILLLHSLGRGGLLKNTVEGSTQYNIVYFIEICAYCAVNIFALISGYVSYSDEKKKIKVSNCINLWLEVVFYCLVITFIFDILKPQEIPPVAYLISIFPITNGLYWYFIAYTGLFVIMPILNEGIRHCEKRTLKIIFFVMIFSFSVLGTISKGLFNLNEGNSYIWIVLLYVLGSIMKKCEILKNVKTYKLIIGIILVYAVTYLYWLYGVKFSMMNNLSVTRYQLISYISPTILISAIFQVVLFSRLKFNNIGKKIIKFMVSSAFAVYLINTNFLVWRFVMNDLFVGIAHSSVIKILVYVFGFSILFVIGSILIDKIRIFLFKICRVNDVLKKLDNKLEKAL